jgi:hypothetical protein
MSDPALSTASLQAGRSSPAAAILAAANRLLPDLQQGARVDSTRLRTALETAFGGSDGRSVGLEIRLRRLRGGHRPVPAQIRSGDARARRIGHHAAGNAGESLGPLSDPHPPLGGEPRTAAILDAGRSGISDSGRPTNIGTSVNCER